MAAQQGVFKSQVSVTYDADVDLIASVKASYQMENSSIVNLGEIVYDGSDDPIGSISDIGNLAFDRNTKEYVEFTFEFKNDSSYDDFTAVLAFTDGTGGNGKVENMDLTAKLNGAEDTKFSSGTLSELTKFTVGVGETKTFVLKVAIHDDTVKAEFIGTLEWKMSVV